MIDVVGSILQSMSLSDEIEIAIQRRAWDEARQAGLIPPELADVPILEVVPICDCDAGLSVHEEGVLACPECHQAGIARGPES